MYLFSFLSLLLPSATIVVERYCFHKHVSRILSTGGDIHSPLGRPPPGRHPPDGHCGGRYASHWNAFLLFNVNIKFVSLGIHLEEKTLLLQSKRTLQILYPFFLIKNFVIKKRETASHKVLHYKSLFLPNF